MNLPVRTQAAPGDLNPAVVFAALIALGGVVSSFTLACAAPFAAFIALAACFTRTRTQALLVGFVWLANQAIGFSCLGYSMSADTVAWGGIMGAASVITAVVAAMVAPRVARFGIVAQVGITFVAAIAAYELALLGGCYLLPDSECPFTLAVVTRVVELNAVSLAIVVIAQRAIMTLGALLSNAKAARAQA